MRSWRTYRISPESPLVFCEDGQQKLSEDEGHRTIVNDKNNFT